MEKLGFEQRLIDDTEIGLDGYVELDESAWTTDDEPLQGVVYADEKIKRIGIEWDRIPVHILIPKLERALEYAFVGLEGSGYLVKRWDGTGDIYETDENYCACPEWINRGTSVNPCKHQVRIRYTDEEIKRKLQELQGSREVAVVPFERKPLEKETPQSPVFKGIVQPRLCEIGKIKIGEIVERTKGDKKLRLPKKLDHFEIMSILRDDGGNLIRDKEMHEILGEKPIDLDIYLCYDNPELNMPTYYAYFTQTKLRCMGDGIKALQTTDGGLKEEIVCDPKTCKAYQGKLCKPYGRLSVILSKANRIGGSYVLRTTSWNTLRNIITSMLYIRRITGGVLAGIPLSMRLIPMQVQPKDLGRTVKIYTVNIEYDGSMEKLKEAANQEVQRRLQLGMDMRRIEAEEMKVITEYVREEAEEKATEIAEEFAPENKNGRAI